MQKNPFMYCIAKVMLFLISLFEYFLRFVTRITKHPNFKPYVVTCSLFLGVGLSFSSLIDMHEDTPVIVIEHVVEKGDTIWTIADEFWSGDTRDAVSLIQQYNHLTSERIYPGQLLQVPVKLSDVDNN